jgi:hypothetical protein
MAALIAAEMADHDPRRRRKSFWQPTLSTSDHKSYSR